MNVVVNGESHELSGGTTVAALIDALGRSPKGMAVAINEEVVPRSTWRDVQLQAGDRVEVLTAAQGG
ncbi:MAG TPA: sulfur carrier protein ThiS [Acidimicrobiales bacterium]|nr:sulfur carrier protein ThiS [Acidimicrobiales bacterium]